MGIVVVGNRDSMYLMYIRSWIHCSCMREAQEAFSSGEAVFMRNWPAVYGLITDPARSQLTPEQVGVAAIPIVVGHTSAGFDSGLQLHQCRQVRPNGRHVRAGSSTLFRH